MSFEQQPEIRTEGGQVIEIEKEIENNREIIENGILKSSIFEKFKDHLGVGATTKELNRILDRENERIRITAPQDRFDKRFDQEDSKRRKDKISAGRIIINALRRIAPGMDPHDIQKTALEHGSNIAVVDEEYLAKDKKERARVLADGMITNLKETPLMVVAADCAPVGIYDPTNEAIGAFHSGWKGTLKQISRKGVEALCKNYGSKPEDLLTVIGPRAGGEDFEVDQKVYDEFIGAKDEEENPIYTPEEVATFFKARPEKPGFYFLDTGLAIKTSLLKAGVLEEHIQISQYSTMSEEGNKLFPSERREGQEKRDSFAFLMALKEAEISESEEKIDKREYYHGTKESWTEEKEVGGNQLVVDYTGREKWDKTEKATRSETEDIKIRNQEGKEIKFASFLPKGWRFNRINKTKKGMYIEHILREVTFPEFQRKEKLYGVPDEEPLPREYKEKRRGREIKPDRMVVDWEDVETFDDPMSLLDLLHEIAHAHQKYAELTKHGKVREEIHKKNEKGENLSAKDLEIYYRSVIKIERDAWAYALRKYRELKRNGTDLMLGVSNSDILDTIHKNLNTYLVSNMDHYEGFRDFKKRKETTIQRTLDRLKRILGK